MSPLANVLLAITGLFVFFLVVKEASRRSWCVLCASIAATWIAALILFWKGLFQNTFLLGLLMGQSITGIYYLADRWKGNTAAGIFRLPFVLTLIVLFADLVKGTEVSSALPIVGAVWLLMLLIFVLRKNEGLKHVAERIIQCCKNW